MSVSTVRGKRGWLYECTTGTSELIDTDSLTVTDTVVTARVREGITNHSAV